MAGLVRPEDPMPLNVDAHLREQFTPLIAGNLSADCVLGAHSTAKVAECCEST
jgi:hypothetical protein